MGKIKIEHHKNLGYRFNVDGVYYSIYYPYTQWAPHNVIRRIVSRLIYKWADKKYGVNARSGQWPPTPNDEIVLTKWRFWMSVKNRIQHEPR